MLYFGGKRRIAKEIARVISPRGVWWEPFCGGLSVSTQLRHYYPGLVSDANEALISLYTAVRANWTPPVVFYESEYHAAKDLPNTDPRKAFAGIAMSFGGKWFGGFAGARSGTFHKAGILRYKYWAPARAASESLVRDVSFLTDCEFRCLNFLAVVPEFSTYPPECIYADPPYQGFTGYAAAGTFNHTLFWDLCRRWAARGTRVFVSSYVAPQGIACVVWEKPYRDRMINAQGGQTAKTERLFAVYPP